MVHPDYTVIASENLELEGMSATFLISTSLRTSHANEVLLEVRVDALKYVHYGLHDRLPFVLADLHTLRSIERHPERGGNRVKVSLLHSQLSSLSAKGDCHASNCVADAISVDVWKLHRFSR
jgi:hypothetical protein